MNRAEQKIHQENTSIKGLQKKFPSADKKGIKWIFKNTNKIVRMYNGFCPSCKALAMENPSRPSSDYCIACQSIAREVIEK
jgi:hypothetical protein